MPKMLPCCARAQYKAQAQRAEIQRLAKTAARFDALGKSTTRTLAAIAREKEGLAVSEQAIIDHEASHAGEAEEVA